MKKNIFEIFVITLVVSFGILFSGIESVSASEEAGGPEVETFLEKPNGELEDISLDVDIQDNGNSVKIVEPSSLRKDNLEKDLNSGKLDTSTKFYPEVLSSLQLSLKNFSQYFRKQAKEGEVVFFDEIDVVLQNSDIAKSEIDADISLLEKRGPIATFFFGPNYGSMKRLKIKFVDIENISKQSEYLSTKIENAEFKAMLKAFSVQLLMQRDEHQEKVKQFESKKSMFGWIIRIFY